MTSRAALERARQLLESQLQQMLEKHPDVGCGDWLVDVEGDEVPVSQGGCTVVLHVPVRFRFRVVLEEKS